MKLNRAIGVIDSGVGGLTVAKELIRQLPKERIIYLGDTARCPYGPRSREEVRQFTWEMTEHLLGLNIKMLVIACNTATAVVLEEMQKTITNSSSRSYSPRITYSFKSDKHVSRWDYWNDWNGEKWCIRRGVKVY